MVEFNKLRKNCPWYETGWGGICRASSFMVKAFSQHMSHRPGGENLLCCKKNCAIYYWLKIERQGIS